MRSKWAVGKKIAILVLLLLFIWNISNTRAAAMPEVSTTYQLGTSEWQVSNMVQATTTFDQTFVMNLYEQAIEPTRNWVDINTYLRTVKRSNNDNQFGIIRIQIPTMGYSQPAVYINNLRSTGVAIVVDDEPIHLSVYDYPQEDHVILLPLANHHSDPIIYIIANMNGEASWKLTNIVVGEQKNLQSLYIQQGSLSIITGLALLFVSVVISVCTMFIHRSIRSSWYALGLLMMSLSIIIMAESTYMYTIWEQWGYSAYYIKKIATSIAVVSLFYFVQSLWGKGINQIIVRMKNVQVTITAIHLIWLFVAFMLPITMSVYNNYINYIIWLQIALSILFFGRFSLYLIRTKQTVGWFLISGIVILLLSGLIEAIVYYVFDYTITVHYWQYSSVFFLVTLIVALVKQALANYEQVLRYSQKLERFNTDLQRAEKMEIISQLAASVAHEVRNPLQITRGFLQLLMHSPSSEKKVSYMELAISELDRANSIISDFLGFAKPQVEGQSILQVEEELEQIRAIIHPLVVIHGNQFKARLESNLYVLGNSSAFKQAIINLIKNAIEATEKDGLIAISAYRVLEKNKVVITIEDNGEGMSETDLKNLGEPFYSQKSKGTGLGITITYNIIEAMGGLIYYTSTLGVGTIVKVELPLASPNALQK